MNYLREIMAFNDLAEVERITPKEQAIWRAMMSIANSMGWASTFTVANLTLQSKAVLSEREVTEARNRLVQRGIITYKKNTGNRAPTYGLVSLADKPADKPAGSYADNPATKCVDKPADKPADNPAALYKLNKTKLNEMKEGKNPRAKSPKHKYGEYQNVMLTDSEHEKLSDEFADLDARIDRLSEYMASTGKPYKSHYATIKAWARKDQAQHPEQRGEDVQWAMS